MRRSKTISLRLSEQELEQLKTVYPKHGARSISEFARIAMQSVVAGSADGHHRLDLKVQELEGKLRLLDGELARLSSRFETELNKRRGNRHEKD